MLSTGQLGQLPSGSLDPKRHGPFNAQTLGESRPECCGLCWLLITIPFLFCFVYHLMPTAVLLYVVSCFLLGLAPLASGSSLLAGSFTALVLVFAQSGLYLYHAAVQPMRSFQDGRTYTGVYATQPAAAFADAAVLRFAGNATVDDSKSVGLTMLEGGVNTFCVAPVIDKSSSTARVEFWAIGLDCCGRVSNFECDDAGLPTNHDGYVVPDPRDGDVWFDKVGKYFAPSIARRDLFLKAIRSAEAVHDVASSDRAVLVRWSSASRTDLIQKGSLAMGLFLGFSVLISVVASLLLGPLVRQLRVGMDTYAAYQSQYRDADSGPKKFHDLIIQGFIMPVLAFVFGVIFVTWKDCWALGDLLVGVYMICVAGSAAALLLSTKTFRYGVFVVVATIMGTLIGHRNYVHNSFYFCSVLAHRSYSNVRADAKAVEYLDAGQIHFEEGAKLGTNQSFGFLHRGVTYCAAPIVAPACATAANASSAPMAALVAVAVAAPAAAPVAAPSAAPVAAPCEVNFWAVGSNCCNHIGGFTCVKDSEWGHEALVLRSLGEQGVGDELRRHYLQAARAAADRNQNFLLPDESMLLVPAKKSGSTGTVDVIQQDWKGAAIGICLLTSAVAFGAFAGLAFLGLWWDKRKGD